MGQQNQVSVNWRKATYSPNGESCVEVGNWRKATYSGNGETCVEVGTTDAVLVRDTTNRNGATLTFSAPAWQSLVAILK